MTHIDADMLAAFAERALRKEEQAAILAHFSECEKCRAWSNAYEELHGFHPLPAEPCEHARLKWPALAGAAALIGALVVLAILPSPSTRKEQQSATLATVNRLQVFHATPVLANQFIPPPVWRHPAINLHTNRIAQPSLVSLLLSGKRKQQLLALPDEHSSFHKITFAEGHVSFRRISVDTAMGERWLTVNGFGEVAWENFQR